MATPKSRRNWRIGPAFGHFYFLAEPRETRYDSVNTKNTLTKRGSRMKGKGYYRQFLKIRISVLTFSRQVSWRHWKPSSPVSSVRRGLCCNVSGYQSFQGSDQRSPRTHASRCTSRQLPARTRFQIRQEGLASAPSPWNSGRKCRNPTSRSSSPAGDHLQHLLRFRRWLAVVRRGESKKREWCDRSNASSSESSGLCI